MKTLINNDQYIVTFDKDIIEDLTLLNKNLKTIKNDIKEIILDLRHVKYTSSIFIDFVNKYNSLIKDSDIKLKLINCPENIYNLFVKSIKDLSFEIKLKDI